MEEFLNMIFFRKAREKTAKDKFINCISSEFAEEFLELLLRLMSLVFFIDKDYRKNIKDFDGRYLFRSMDDNIHVAAIFKKNRLKVYEKEIDGTNVRVTFRNAAALMNFLLSPKPDILGSILRQDISIDGNLNYLYKFAFMAKRLQLMATGKR